MRLFDLKNYALTISEEAYALKPFKAIWNRDKTKTKDIAIAELAFIFYLEDFRSDFADILNDVLRRAEVQVNVALPSDWKEDSVVKEAREFYKKRTEEVIAITYLKNAKHAVNEISEFLGNVDSSEKDSKGKFVYDVVKVKQVIGDSASLIENLNNLEKIVKRDLEEAADVRGAKKKAIFEDGIK